LLKQLPVVAFESADAMQAAKLRAALQRTGKPIGPYDGLIAATALARDMILVTNNTCEFSRVIDLMVEDWQS
jgi:tRNA(fMet)-specific endonuclease VapC